MLPTGWRLYAGCFIIGLSIGLVVPFPYTLLVAIPAGFLYGRWYQDKGGM